MLGALKAAAGEAALLGFGDPFTEPVHEFRGVSPPLLPADPLGVPILNSRQPDRCFDGREEALTAAGGFSEELSREAKMCSAALRLPAQERSKQLPGPALETSFWI